MPHSSSRLFSFVNLGVLLLCSAPATLALNEDDSKDAPAVHINSISGDVRLSRGKHAKVDLYQPWEQAEPGIAIEQGFALATGEGTAEVEFENGEYTFLAPNSVLLFNEITQHDGIPFARLGILTGAAAFSRQVYGPDTFLVEAASHGLLLENGDFFRIDIFLDGISVTPLAEGQKLQLGAEKLQLALGRTYTFAGPEFKGDRAGKAAASDSDWSGFVSRRMQERQTAQAAALKVPGISSDLPGLADLYSTGNFFSCEPYGTCWQSAADQEPSTAAKPPSENDPAQLPVPNTRQPLPQSPRRPIVTTDELVQGCPFSRRMRTLRYLPDPNTPSSPGKKYPWEETAIDSIYTPCDFGSWIHYRGHYAWVVPGKRPPRIKHHPPVHPPVRWVRAGNRVGFVPRHPNDVKGKPPINLKNGIFLAPVTPGGKVEHIDFYATKQIKLLEHEPKNLRSEFASHGSQAEKPVIQARFLNPYTERLAAGARAGNAHEHIVYDYKSHNFVQPGGGHTSSGKPVAVASLNSHGGTTSFGSSGGGRGGGGGSSSSGGGGRSNSASSSSGGSGGSPSSHGSSAGSSTSSGASAASSSSGGHPH